MEPFRFCGHPCAVHAQSPLALLSLVDLEQHLLIKLWPKSDITRIEISETVFSFYHVVITSN